MVNLQGKRRKRGIFTRGIVQIARKRNVYIQRCGHTGSADVWYRWKEGLFYV